LLPDSSYNTIDGEDGRELRLRCVLRLDAAQGDLLDRLGLELPERLRIDLPHSKARRCSADFFAKCPKLRT
jgi:hypothetical protein